MDKSALLGPRNSTGRERDAKKKFGHSIHRMPETVEDADCLMYSLTRGVLSRASGAWIAGYRYGIY